jgi:hypothetical protein
VRSGSLQLHSAQTGRRKPFRKTIHGTRRTDGRGRCKQNRHAWPWKTHRAPRWRAAFTSACPFLRDAEACKLRGGLAYRAVPGDRRNSRLVPPIPPVPPSPAAEETARLRGRRYSPRERPLEPRRSLTRRSGQVARAVAGQHSGTAGPRRELRIVCAIPHAMRLTLQSVCPRGRQPWASLLWPGLSPGPRSALLIDPSSASRMSLWSGLWSALSLPDPAI